MTLGFFSRLNTRYSAVSQLLLQFYTFNSINAGIGENFGLCVCVCVCGCSSFAIVLMNLLISSNGFVFNWTFLWIIIAFSNDDTSVFSF